MNRILVIAFLSFTLLASFAANRYDFRASDDYAQLSTTDKQKLEQAHRDLILLWGALDMYADDHGDELPASLDDLVPRYLAELPSDPFITEQNRTPQGYIASRNGLGYGYKPGSPGNRAWVIASVGLPRFPYRGKNNFGVHVVKGTWLSGRNPSLEK